MLLLLSIVFALANAACSDLPTWQQLKTALTTARGQDNGGFNLDMWGTIVDRDGIVCAVAFTGTNRGSQWPGSRVISAQKANTGNAFSLDGLALSTANLYAAVQPGGSLFGLQASNPVAPTQAYAGAAANFGTASDPMVNNKIGGINVFGGGFALYNSQKKIIGGLGVSGDSSCADHAIGWRTRAILELDYVPGGVSGQTSRPDTIVYGNPATVAWSQPHCVNATKEDEVAAALPIIRGINT